MLNQKGHIRAFKDPSKEKSFPSEFKATIIFADDEIYEDSIAAYTFEDAFESLIWRFAREKRTAKNISLEFFR
ncbi:hypothetical protein [Lysinibacillus sp. NPDC093692]|uniref:hypothetical protein n=1 Tax=Lysinibacillus sp. NPDC093692 TaxID=3390578 RepID=UPI003D04AA5E